jgi:hypothetical protein
MKFEIWAIEKLIFYARNPRKNEEVPVIVCEAGSAAQMNAFRDLSLTGFKPHETNGLACESRRFGTYALVGEVCDAAA